MKKIKLSRKIIVILKVFIIIQFLLFSNRIVLGNVDDRIHNTSGIMATNENDFVHSEDESIIKYDSITGVSEIVNLDTIQKELQEKGYNANNYEIKAYTPTTDSKVKDYEAIETPRTITYYNADINSYTARKICRIKANANDGQLIGTGFLLGKNILVTAAHLVFDPDNNDAIYSNWVAYPGYDLGSSYNNASSGWSQVYYSSAWLSTHSPDYDWCICILNASDLGVGWLGATAYTNNSDMNNLSAKVQGYPYYGGGVGEIQKYTTGYIYNTQNYYFSSTAGVSEGMSGSPYLRSDDVVVGVCHGYWENTEISVGVRITSNMINIIINNS